MNLGEFVTLLGQRLGSRTDLDARIKVELNHIQETVLEGAGAFLPWFLQSSLTTLNTVADDENVAFPTGFLREIEESHPFILPTGSLVWKKLRKRTLDILTEQGIVTGVPTEYAIGPTGFVLYQVPNAVMPIKLRYYKADTVPVADGDTNLWLTHAADLVLAEVGFYMATFHLRDEKRTALFEGQAIKARQRLFVANEAREHANQRYGMGED